MNIKTQSTLILMQWRFEGRSSILVAKEVRVRLTESEIYIGSSLWYVPCSKTDRCEWTGWERGQVCKEESREWARERVRGREREGILMAGTMQSPRILERNASPPRGGLHRARSSITALSFLCSIQNSFLLLILKKKERKGEKNKIRHFHFS